MPFSQRTVHEREDVQTIITDARNPKILQKASVSNMIGLMTQLNELSKHAAEVFGTILQQTDKQAVRIKMCKERIRDIEKLVPVAEKRLVESAPMYFYDNPYTGKEYSRRDPINGLLFRRDRSTMELNRRRDLADPPPDFGVMDKFSLGKPCVKLFFDADFFLNEWLAAEKLRIAEEKKRRKAKKAERRAKKAARSGKDKGGKKKIQKVKKKVYSKYGAEYQSEEKQADDYVFVEDRLQGSRTDFRVESTEREAAARKVSAGTDAMGNPILQPAKMKKVASAGPRPAAAPIGSPAAGGRVQSGHVASAAPKTAPIDARPAPQRLTRTAPSAVAAMAKSRSQAPAAAAPSTGPPMAAPSMGAASGGPPPAPSSPVFRPEDVVLSREDMTLEMRVAESRRMAEEKAAHDEAKRERIAQEQAKAKREVGGGAAGLMASIRGSHQLKKSEIVKREFKKDTRSQLLDSIAKGHSGLKKVDAKAIAEQRARERQEEQEGNTIYAALNARRGLIADDSDSDDSYESDDDWDDDD